MDSKSVKDTLLNRTSVRRYEREAITPDQLNLIYEAIRNTPTSYNGQQFSVIDISDQDVKERLAEITGQKQIKTCNHFMAFCVDYNKIFTFAKARGIDYPTFNRTIDGFTVGVVDASLAMMSALTAAESVGLGCCCIGYARTAAPAVISVILKLPKNVFLVCGLSIGVPREQHDLKPKQPATLLIHQNHYRTDDMVPELAQYDEEVKHYNATREGDKTTNDWLTHILGYYREAMSYEMLAFLASKGFVIEK